MVTFEECLTFANLSEDAIDAIARHEQLPILQATELGEALVKTRQGQQVIRLFMEENCRRAASMRRAAVLESVLERFCQLYPRCASRDSGIDGRPI